MKKKSFFMLTALMLVLSVFISACTGGSNRSNSAPASGEKEEPTSAETRSFKTVKGDMQIPVKPQRIVTDFYGGDYCP
ncbi:ABC-type Fe3+-hydroxamate transport system substrate-binding protein [Paenibacillus brasilensis]|uniref:ABC-type Fe3+-hydroxamate transport system substrate-binding protein n=1 Tax=Paenibacillus brasilensis TaxID=128574 RepID=A0ABU0L269_9BACL|nr:ABC-type Fe3+-hydroxamate transport system substrate-binding protein [Paenibacillus brasilensis]